MASSQERGALGLVFKATFSKSDFHPVFEFRHAECTRQLFVHQISLNRLAKKTALFRELGKLKFLETINRCQKQLQR